MVTLTKLTRKLVRDIKASKWQFTGVVLLVVMGMIFFVGLISSFENLWNSVNGPYQTLNFADFTVRVYSAPANVTEEIKQIDGVKAVVGRVVTEVPMTMPTMENQFLTGRVITLPSDAHPLVNDVQIMEGSYFTLNSGKEVLLEKFFADYHNLKVEDTVRLTSGSNQTDFMVRGLVISPEYLWPARNVKDHMPTVLRNWGVVFLPEDYATWVLNFKGRINEVAVTVTDPSVRDDIVDKVKTILKPYGLAEVTVKENQASDKILHLMLGSLNVLAPVFSGFFLAVASVTTYVLLTRMVNTQSTQIGTMRALGYGRTSILRYYLSFTFLIGLTSSVIGVILGFISSIYLTKLFASRISLPIVLFQPQWVTYTIGSTIAIGMLLIASVFPAWQAASLKPVEAMRPQAPKWGRVVRMDRALFFRRHASSFVKMPLRNLIRSKQRSLAMVLGIMLATSVVVSVSSFMNSFDYLFKVMYEDISNYDMRVAFIQPQNATQVDSAKNISGVVAVEPILVIPYHLRHNEKEYSVTISGLSADGTLYRLYELSGEPSRVDAEGILLAQTLRDKLDVESGDSLELHFLNSSNYVNVAGFVKSPFGDSAYLSLQKAQEILGIGDRIGGLLVAAEPQAQEDVKQELYRLPNVSGIETVAQQKEDNMEMLKLFNGFIWTIFSFGVLMAFAVVFNIVSLNILERSRELATMRTIGVTMRQITGMVTFENVLLGLVGVLLGLPMGNYLAKYFFSFFSSDLFVMEVVTYASTYALGMIVIFTVLLVSSVPGLRHVKNLNLAKMVKEQSR